VVELPQVRHAARLFGDPDYLPRIVALDLDSYATPGPEAGHAGRRTPPHFNHCDEARRRQPAPSRSQPEAAQKAEAKRTPHPRTS
jgi:hypothetical protein